MAQSPHPPPRDPRETLAAFEMVRYETKTFCDAVLKGITDAELEYMKGFLQLGFGISTLGASITFSLIVLPMNPPANRVHLTAVNTLLAVTSWVLFLVTLLIYRNQCLLLCLPITRDHSGSIAR